MTPSANGPWQMLTNPAMFGITMLNLDVWCQPYPQLPDYPGIIQITAGPQPQDWLKLEWAVLDSCPSQVIETSKALRGTCTWMHTPWHSVANIVKPSNKLPLARLMSVPHHHWLPSPSSSVTVREVSESTMLGGGSLFFGSTFHVTGGGNYTSMCTLPLRRNK